MSGGLNQFDRMKSDKSRLLAPHSKHILGPPIQVSSRAEPPVCQPEQTFTNFNCNNVGNERAVFPLLLVLSSYEWHTYVYNSDVFSFSHIVTNSPVFVTSPDGSVLIAQICLKAQTAIVSLTSSHCGCLVIRDQRQEVTWAESSQSEASVEVTWLILTNQRPGVRSPDHRMLFSPDYDGPSLRLTMNPLILNTSTSDVKQTITWAQFVLNKL